MRPVFYLPSTAYAVSVACAEIVLHASRAALADDPPELQGAALGLAVRWAFDAYDAGADARAVRALLEIGLIAGLGMST